MSIDELLLIIFGIAMLAWAAIIKQWGLFWIFTAFFVCFGIIEMLWKKVVMKLTVSQDFQKYSLRRKFKAWIMIGIMAAFFTTLLVHLSAKLIFKH